MNMTLCNSTLVANRPAQPSPKRPRSFHVYTLRTVMTHGDPTIDAIVGTKQDPRPALLYIVLLLEGIQIRPALGNLVGRALGRQRALLRLVVQHDEVAVVEIVAVQLVEGVFGLEHVFVDHKGCAACVGRYPAADLSRGVLDGLGGEASEGQYLISPNLPNSSKKASSSAS